MLLAAWPGEPAALSERDRAASSPAPASPAAHA